MTCREMIEFLMDYLDGQLPEDQVAVFEKHLEMCPPCKAYLETYRKSVDLASVCFGDDDQTPKDVPEALIRAILAAREKQD